MSRIFLAFFLLLAAASSCCDQRSPDEPRVGYEEGLNIETQLLNQKRLRLIAYGVETWAESELAYPGPTGDFVSTSFLESYLEPQILEQVPTIDPWGSEYLYYSDAKNYVILSRSMDRTYESDYSQVLESAVPPASEWGSIRELCIEETGDLNADLIWVAGAFCQAYRIPSIGD